MKASVVVIAQDEAHDLAACLRSAALVASELVVVDGGSTDGTQALARSLGARVVERPFDGFVEQKAFAFSQARSPWVLSLDADERLSPELAAEIAALEPGGAAGYELDRDLEFLGRRLRFGGKGPVQLRLFRRDAARVVGGRVHERIEVRGETGSLRAPLLHRPYRDLSEYLAKLDRYTSLAAREALERGRRSSPLHHLVLPGVFFKRYVLQLGVLDGAAGFVWCALAAYYAWLKRLKLRELELSAAPARPAAPRPEREELPK